MPKKVLPCEDDFKQLKENLQSMGFHQFYPSVDFDYSKEPKKFSEIGFVFRANGLRVVVWTTWEMAEDEKIRVRNSDASWVIILDDKRTLYFSHPIHRTKNFLRNLLYQVKIAWLRVIYRPRCPECGKFMDIAFGKGLKSRYWKCNRRLEHKGKKSINCSWDTPLPPTIKKHLKSIRSKRAKYFKKRRKERKEIYSAFKKRWRKRQIKGKK